MTGNQMKSSRSTKPSVARIVITGLVAWVAMLCVCLLLTAYVLDNNKIPMPPKDHDEYLSDGSVCHVTYYWTGSYWDRVCRR